MKVFCHYLKQALYEKFSLDVHLILSKKEVCASGVQITNVWLRVFW